MQATKETKILLIRLLAQSSYSETDKQAIATAFKIPQSIIEVNSMEQKQIVTELMEKE